MSIRSRTPRVHDIPDQRRVRSINGCLSAVLHRGSKPVGVYGILVLPLMHDSAVCQTAERCLASESRVGARDMCFMPCKPAPRSIGCDHSLGSHMTARCSFDPAPGAHFDPMRGHGRCASTVGGVYTCALGHVWLETACPALSFRSLYGASESTIAIDHVR